MAAETSIRPHLVAPTRFVKGKIAVSIGASTADRIYQGTKLICVILSAAKDDNIKDLEEKIMNIIQKLEAEQMKDKRDGFQTGDLVIVQVKVKEGNRERLQAFEGVVIAKSNRG